MGTVPEPPEVELTGGQVIIHKTERAARVLIAGHEVGAIRRIGLYAIVALALSLGLAPVGLVALLFLATTDVLR